MKRVRDLHAIGCNDCQIARITGIPRGTIRAWLYPRYVPRPGSKQGRICFRCDDPPVPAPREYSYLLGLYLGDGCLSPSGREGFRLRIVQDQRYVNLIEECERVILAMGPRSVHYCRAVGCVEIGSNWKHWIHLLPQHGPGPKWRRRIVLEPWQREVVADEPKQFLRGLIHSDGCRTTNVVHRTWQGRRVRYAYPRYFFSNASDDIRMLFTDACDLLGLRWTQTNARVVAVSRSSDVAFLDTFIGPKS